MTASIPLSQQNSLTLESLLHRIINRVLQSLELSDILSATVAEVRTFLNTDRVMVYQFHGDGSGQVVAESIDNNRLPSLLGLNFPADDIPAHTRELFLKAQVRSIIDVERGQISQSFLRNPETGAILPDNIRDRSVDGCHVEYLMAMGLKSSLALPILHYQQLWGLLVSHHSEPRAISREELQAVQMVVDQLAVAIAQSLLLTQSREKAQLEATVNQIATLLRSRSPSDLQAALQETVNALGGSGGRLYIQSAAFETQESSTGHLVQFRETSCEIFRLFTEGIQPILSEETGIHLLEKSGLWQEYFQANQAEIWAISDLYQIPELNSFYPAFQPTQIRSILVVPLQYGHQHFGYLTIFCDEIEIETLWAGQLNPDQRQEQARHSFAAWKESKKAQAYTWSAYQIELAKALTSHFAAAIMQQEIHWQLQAMNTNLEKQAQERTVKLQQSTEQQQALLEVVTKIRESLIAPETIFRTATQEVCQLLKTERVAVYRFEPDWGGKFIHDFESVTLEWKGRFKLGENLVWDDTYLQMTQGGRYRNNETFAVDNIELAGLYRCHADILRQFQIQAFAIAPIFVRQNLWGLLAAYQHSTTRRWEDSEVKFLAQTAAQLGMALQQAELISQTRQQAEQLAQTLDDLRKTQTQLIQTEKISSLGQLVAGVAHEINNPVNFIYGNLTPAREYTQELLDLIQLYQQEFPNASPVIRDRIESMDLAFIAEDLPKLLSSMKVGADRIRQIVLSLLNFSRLDQAELKLVNIHEGLESTLVILQHRLKAKPDSPGIEVIKDYGKLPLVECYPGQLNQVFMNILSNAIDAIDQLRQQPSQASTGAITIRSFCGEDKINPSIIICIADNGPGISEALKNRIFDPFFTTKPVGKGTGLGLSISYQIIVEKHGGTLKCQPLMGGGTEFSIEIPQRQRR